MANEQVLFAGASGTANADTTKDSPTFENEVKTLITQILRGQNLSKDEMRNVKQLLPMLSNVDAVIKLANQVQAKYSNSESTVRTNLTAFVNVLSRLGDSYDTQYQELTSITSKHAKNYSEERDENVVYILENTFNRPTTGIKQERRSPQERRCGRRDRRTQTQTKRKDDRE